MTIDIFIIIVFSGLVFLGWRSGALRQVVRVLGLAAVVVAGPFVAQVLREAILQETDLGAPASEAVLLFCAGLIIYFGVSLAGWLAIKIMRAASDTLGNLDRFGGASIGAAKAAAAIYLLVFVALFFEAPLAVADPDDRLHMRDGHTSEFVKTHNVLAPWHLPEVDTFHDVVVVAQTAQEKGKQAVVREDAVAAEILRNPAILELVNDEALVAAARANHYHVTFAHEGVREVINDDELWSRVEVVDWESLNGQMAEPEGAKAPLALSDNIVSVIDEMKALL